MWPPELDHAMFPELVNWNALFKHVQTISNPRRQSFRLIVQASRAFTSSQIGAGPDGLLREKATSEMICNSVAIRSMECMFYHFLPSEFSGVSPYTWNILKWSTNYFPAFKSILINRAPHMPKPCVHPWKTLTEPLWTRISYRTGSDVNAHGHLFAWRFVGLHFDPVWRNANQLVCKLFGETHLVEFETTLSNTCLIRLVNHLAPVARKLGVPHFISFPWVFQGIASGILRWIWAQAGHATPSAALPEPRARAMATPGQLQMYNKLEVLSGCGDWWLWMNLIEYEMVPAVLYNI